MLKVICPECDNEIRNLTYKQDAVEIGGFNWIEDLRHPENIRDADRECEDTVDDGDIRYECPECAYSLELEELIIEFEDGTRKNLGEWEAETAGTEQPTAIDPVAQFQAWASRTNNTLRDSVEPAVIRPRRTNLVDTNTEDMPHNVVCPIDNRIILVADGEQSVECPQCGIEIKT